MKFVVNDCRTLGLIAGLAWLVGLAGTARTLAASGAEGTNEIRIVELQGTVELSPVGAATWVFTQTNQVLHSSDRLRVGPRSRVAVRWSDQSIVSFGALTELEVQPPPASGSQSGLRLLHGILSFFHRDEPGRLRVVTRGATAGVEGTEFGAKVETVGGVEQTTFAVIDGKVNFGNDQGALVLTNGQQATAQLGQVPVRTAGFVANNLLQWCFYYPAVLDLRDLSLSREAEQVLSESLAAYRAGDVLGALDKFPAPRQPASEAERIYHAALLLSVGQVQETEAALATLPAAEPMGRPQRLANALRQLIAAVKREDRAATLTPQLSTELLAASYYEQSRAGGETSLRTALDLARQAASQSPEFGFAWERVAELEFSFGHTSRALEALNQSLALAPRNAQAVALQGYLLAAQNKIRAASERFDQAIALDSALGNAWLGRGLCRIRRGDASGGREDLLVAAAIEPQRALLRSYLGKAYANAGDRSRARHELDLAKKLDPADPTAWLYSALLREQANGLNASIRDLEKSQELNANRRVYRSQLLLDQDRAVRSANLARIYDEAGLSDVAVREAGSAVAADYANFSAHRFLSDAYQLNRGDTPFGQRYETPAFSEHLISTLLGPADGRLLSQTVSQQEYGRLFERDSLGLSSTTEYLSRGAGRESGAQFGTFGGTSYSLDADYLSDPGQAPNAQLETRFLSVKVKQMLTPQDGVLLQVYDARWEGGDTSQHYDPAATIKNYHFTEKQSPDVLLGYHREWSPNSHTLILASRFDDATQFYQPAGPAVMLLADPDYPAAGVTDLTRSFNRRYIANTIELQQLQKIGAHSLILGTRLQHNQEEIANQDSARPVQNNNLGPDGMFTILFPDFPFFFPSEAVQVTNERFTLYGYDYWQLTEHWLLFGGLDADFLKLARNTIAPPLSHAHDPVNQVSPKAGLLWEPSSAVAVKLAYAQSLNGQDLDQSVRLEPANFAGLPISFRTAFPDSLVGGLSGEHIETWQADGRFRLGANTYAVIGLQRLESHVDREVGTYTFATVLDPAPQPAHTGESLRFQEESLHGSLRRLFGDIVSAGVGYDVAHAKLEEALAIDPALFVPPTSGSRMNEGLLHTLSLDVLANLPNGLFAGAKATWRRQTDLTDPTLGGQLPAEDFWQCDIYAGYRSPRRHFELTLALLNLAGQDYRLHPINAYQDPPRERTLAVTARFNF